MVAKATSSSSKKKSAVGIKSPKTPKEDKMKIKSHKLSKAEHLKTGLNEALVEKATEALLKYHKKTTEDKSDLLGSDHHIQVQFTLLRTPQTSSKKPTRIMIPHPLFQLKNAGNDSLEEPEVCLIVKEESKPWCQEMIERFPEEMGCIKKVLGLQSLRTKHARYEQRRNLLHKYNIFMADDRILPMLSKALGSDFYKAKKLPIPIALTRKEALPFTIQRALNATYMSLSKGTCITVRAGMTSMSAKDLTENIMEIAKNAVPHMPLKWANIQNIAIKTPESVALPIYNKTPEVLRDIAAAAGLKNPETIDTPEKEAKEEPLSKKVTTESEKKRELTSPLLRALKKQKEGEAKTLKKSNKDAPKGEKKKRRMSEDEAVPAEKSSKKQSDDIVAKKPKKATKAEEQQSFISSKKFKGSKKGYVFRMGKEGLGYYVDVKPKVDHMAMDALMRAAKGRGGQKKGRKGRKSW